MNNDDDLLINPLNDNSLQEDFKNIVGQINSRLQPEDSSLSLKTDPEIVNKVPMKECLEVH